MSKKLSSFKTLGIISPAKIFLMTPDAELPGPADIIGMEIELENIPITSAAAIRTSEDFLSPYWKVKEDGSLRNLGKEFVSAPIFGMDIRNSLRVLTKFFTEFKMRPDCSTRAGFHLHMDVGDLTPEELIRLIEVYIIVEPLLYTYVGKDRENNIFCLPWYKTKGVLHRVASLCYSLTAHTEDSIFTNIPKLFKYSGLNLRPIVSRSSMPMPDNEENKTGGHIEFRMATAMYDVEEVMSWVNILLCLKAFAKDHTKSIPNSSEDASKLSGNFYFHSVFGVLTDEQASRFLKKLGDVDVDLLIKKGMRTLSYFKVIRILHAYTRAIVSGKEFLFKNTHAGFKKLHNTVRDADPNKLPDIEMV